MLFRDRLNAVEQSPRIGRLKGRRTFETVLAVIVDAARALHRLLGTGRLQVQLRLLVATALFVGFLPFLRLGYSRGPLPETLIEPVFALLWIVGGASAIAEAWQAKFHRQIGRAHVGTHVTNSQLVCR